MTIAEAAGAPASRSVTRASRDRLGKALADLKDGFARRELWIYLGWWDVKKHYQRSVIGPFWLTLSMGIMVGSLGFLYSQIFNMDTATYLPFLAVGFILWGFIGQSINSACTVFSGASATIRQIRLPFSVHVFQLVWSLIITLAHNMLIYVVVALYYLINPGWGVLMFFPALLVLCLNAFFLGMILGPLCARFRDIPLIVGSIVQVSFFLTPIIWSVEMLPERAIFINFNPFYHLMEIVRDPLLGNPAAAIHWLFCLAMTTVLGVVALLFFARYRSRISYWA